jgi:hypothetical protein
MRTVYRYVLQTEDKLLWQQEITAGMDGEAYLLVWSD